MAIGSSHDLRQNAPDPSMMQKSPVDSFGYSESSAVFAGPTAYPNAAGYRLWATTVSDAPASTVRIASAT